MRMSGPFRAPAAPGIEVEPYVPDSFLVPERKETIGGDAVNGTSLVVPADSSWAETDYVIVQVHVLNGNAPTATGGLVLLGQAVHPSLANVTTFVFGGFRGAASSFTFSWTGSARNTYTATAISNIDPVDPVAGVATESGDYGSPSGQIGPMEITAPESCRGLFGVMAVTRTTLGAPVIRSWVEPSPTLQWLWTNNNRVIEFVTFPFPAFSNVARSPILAPWPTVSSPNREASAVFVVLRKEEGQSTRPPPVPDLTGMTENYNAPSMFYVLTKDGVEVDSGILGEPDTTTSDNGVPLSMDTIVSFFSVSKIIVEAAVRRLEQDGLLDLDDPAVDHMPAFLVNAAHATFAPVTVRQLLQMRSGFSGNTTYDVFADNLAAATTSWISQAFNHNGGYTYENGNFAVLDYIVRQVSGQSFWDYVQTTIFNPLRMYSITAQINRQGTPLWTTSRNAADYTYPLAVPCTAVMGYAGTVRDMAKIAHIFNTDLVLNPQSRQKWFDDKTRMRSVVGHRAAAFRHPGSGTYVAGQGARAHFYLLESGCALATFWNSAQNLTNTQLAEVLDSFL